VAPGTDFWEDAAMRRALIVAVLVACGAASSASAATWEPPAAWLAQARCVHAKEGPWSANTGNGLFGGMQFNPETWVRVGGKRNPAFTHSGDPAYAFSASPQEQLYRAWLLWKHDGGSWRSWGAVGASCSLVVAAIVRSGPVDLG
jgi:hypothetical protein